MAQTYAVCEKCSQMNRVQLGTKKEPVCGACKSPLSVKGAVIEASDASLQNLINKSPLPMEPKLLDNLALFLESNLAPGLINIQNSHCPTI